jgi:hypothetical protein
MAMPEKLGLLALLTSVCKNAEDSPMEPVGLNNKTTRR